VNAPVGLTSGIMAPVRDCMESPSIPSTSSSSRYLGKVLSKITSESDRIVMVSSPVPVQISVLSWLPLELVVVVPLKV
jgi:hypothetical protein